MRSASFPIRVFLAMSLLVSLGNAQLREVSPAATVVPRLVSFSGRASDAQGKAISGPGGITFAIYKDQYEGAPLWMETQNVQADAAGHFTVQLGATKSEGLPLELFASGEARWLGVRVNGEEEQPRVLLLSVPYALKAADAQTLGGLPPSAFMLAPSPANSSSIASSASAVSSTVSNPDISGSGTQSYLPLWTDNNGTLGNSILYQLGSGSSAKIGINIKNPLFTLDVKGQLLVRGLTEMATINYANPSKGYSSQPFNFESSAFNSSTGKYALNHFQWQAEPTGNNTSNPGATLNLQYGTDPAQPSETGLKLSRAGVFTFAPGQTFPGTGTVTSVGLSAPSSDFTVSGSPITKTGTLGLNWHIAPSSANTANAIVKRDASGGFSAAMITTTGVSSTASSGTALLGSSDTGLGLHGISNSSQAIWGESSGTGFSNGSGPDGVHGVAHGANGSGVGGLNTADGGVGVWGEAPGGVGFYTPNNVRQAPSANGWVKAMAFVNTYQAPYNIMKCFNSTLTGAAASTPPCGFNLQEREFGLFHLDFGFSVSDRFFSATPADNLPLHPVCVGISEGSTYVDMYITDCSDSSTGSWFYLFVF